MSSSSPVRSPVKPMLAKRADDFPDGDGWIYEPKWDGFRALVFRDGDDWLLQSRDLKSLNRYFPELEAPILAQLPPRCVLDGEIVVAIDGALDFESLQMRIHPAKSRVDKLAGEIPASLVFWDVLAVADDDLRDQPFEARRARLEILLSDVRTPVHVTPITRDLATARDWFQRFEGAGLDGVMAKRADDVYQPGKRVMLKVKHVRTADCVLGGFRWHKDGNGVGSLLLGLYSDDGRLHHVGVASSFSAKRRRELAEELEPLREGAADGHPWRAMLGDGDHRVPGAVSRWSRGKTLAWEPVRAERVVEVSYGHMEGTRFRHTTKFVRWRVDKPPADCRYDQLEVTPPFELQQIFSPEQ